MDKGNVIKTKLDPSGIENGIEKANRALDKFKSKARSAYDSMAKAIKNSAPNTYNFGKGMQKTLADLKKGIADAFSAKNAQAGLEAIAKAGKDTAHGIATYFKSGFDKVFSDAGAQGKEVADGFNKANVGQGFMAGVKERLQTIRYTIQDIAFDLQKTDKPIISQKNIADAEKGVAKTKSELEKVQNKVADISARWNEWSKKTGNTKWGDFVKTQLSKSDISTLEREETLLRKLETQIARVNKLKEQYNATEWKGKFPNLSGAMDSAKNAISKGLLFITNPVESAKSAISSIGDKAREVGGKVKDGFAGVGDMIIYAVKHPIETLKPTLALVGKGAVSAGKSIVQWLGNYGAKAVERLKEALKGTHKHSGGLNKTFKTGFTTILKYVFGIRSLYFLFRKLRGALVESMGNLAKYSKETTASLSSLKTALYQCKNALATAFQPILTAVAPALTTLINLVSKALTYIAMFFGALTGKKVVFKANKVQQQYGDTLDNTAGNAEKAKEAQEELNETYESGLDDLHKYNEENKDTNDDAGGAGGAGGGAGDLGYDFEEVPIEKKIQDFVDRLKKAWENADFFDIGYELAEKLADALDKIPWDKIKAVAGKLGKSLATLLNGVFANMHLAESLGRTIGEAINTALEFAYNFIKYFDFGQFGRFVGKMILTAFETIDFKKLGQTLAMGINGIFEFAGELFRTEGLFRTIGEKIYDALYNLFYYLDPKVIGGAIHAFVQAVIDLLAGAFGDGKWDKLKTLIGEKFGAIWDAIGGEGDLAGKIGQAITLITALAGALYLLNPILEPVAKGIGGLVTKAGELALTHPVLAGALLAIATILGGIFIASVDKATGAITGLANKINDFVETTDFGKVGRTIGEKITQSIINFDWKNLGKAVSNLFNAFLRTAKEMLANIDFRALGEGIGKSVAGAIENFDFKSAGESLNNFVNGILDFLIGVFVDTDWSEVSYNIYSGIVTALKQVDWLEILRKIGEFIIEGLIGGMIEYFAGKVMAVWDNIIKPLIDKVKGWLGIHSKSTVFAEIGVNIIDGLLKGLKDRVDAIYDFFVKTFETVRDKINNTWESVKTKAQTAWTSIKTTIESKVGEVKTKIETAMSNIKKDWETKWDSIKDKAKTVWNSIKSEIDTKVGNVKDKIKSTLDEIKSNWDSKWDNIKEKVKTVWDNIKSTVDSKLNDLKSKIKSALDEIKSNWDSKWESLKEKASSIWDSIKSSVSTGMESVRSTMNSAMDGISEKWNSAWEGMKSKVNGVWEAVTSKASEVKSAVSSTVNGIANNVNNLVSGLNTTASSISKTISDVKDKASNLASTLSSKTTTTKTTATKSTATPKATPIKTTKLAKGAVIPANREFMAILGDQKHGNNLEAPEGLIRKIVREEAGAKQSGNLNYTFTAQINRKTVFEEIIKEANMRRMATGKNPFALNTL